MLNKPSNMKCLFCGEYQVELITQIDPLSFIYHEITKCRCTQCGYTFDPVQEVSYSNSTDDSYNKSTSNDKYCQNCNTKMEPFGDNWLICPKCYYGQMGYLSASPKESEEVFKKMLKGPIFADTNTPSICEEVTVEQFCKDVIDFLQSEYNDAYQFKIHRYIALPPQFKPFNKARVELHINIGKHYVLKIVNDNMQYLFDLYKSKEYIKDRKQYRWQKELIDMIEGS